jgi:NTE family protein
LKAAQEMKQPKVVLVLQGGGALGSYQAGAFEGLEKHSLSVDWIVGTSIGAINGAIIAGNKPEDRLGKLKGFWQSLSADTSSSVPAMNTLDWLKPWAPAARTYTTLTEGISGFFKPFPMNPWTLLTGGSSARTSFYDTGPLADTLQRYVDFKYLNSSAIKLSVSAVNVATGELASNTGTVAFIPTRRLTMCSTTRKGKILCVLWWIFGTPLKPYLPASLT